MFVFNIKAIREKKGISLRRLSQMTDISRPYLRDLEINRRTNPTLSTLYLIATALEVNIKDLFYSDLDIEKLRKELHKKIKKYGTTSKEAIEISNIIDLLVLLK